MGSAISKLLGRASSKREDYEQLLSQLDEQMRRGILDLDLTRMREKKLHIMFLLYSTAGFVPVLFYLFIFPRFYSTLTSLLVVLLLLLGLLGIKRIINWFYQRKIRNYVDELEILREKKKLKMEEFKKKSGYYKAKRIIERFEEENAQPNKKDVAEVNPPVRQPTEPPVIHLQEQIPTNMPNFVPSLQIQQTEPPHQQQQTISYPQQVAGSKSWMDRLVDALLGELPDQSKYALICSRCHVHNGLCFPDEIETKEFICMNCSHFNRPARLRSPGAASSSQSSLFEAVVGNENNEFQVTTSFSQSIENILPTEHVQDSTVDTIQTEQNASYSNPEATSTSSLDQKSTSQSSLSLLLMEEQSEAIVNETISAYISYIDSLPKELLQMPIAEFRSKYKSNIDLALQDTKRVRINSQLDN